MKCRKIQSIAPLDISSLTDISSQDKERLLAIQSAIEHAWNAYSTTVLERERWKIFFGILPSDDLAPLSNTGIRWLHSAATLFDSLDTLYIAGLVKEYEEAVEFALSLPLPLFMPVKTFEYSIRVLGGLLGAYSVSGDVRTLERSQQIADSLLDGPFRSSPTALPRMYDVLAPSTYVSVWDWGGCQLQKGYAKLYRIIRDYMGEHIYNSLAGVGTFSLEFSFLSSIKSSDQKYKHASDQIYHHVIMKDSNKGRKNQSIPPMLWNVMTGESATTHSGLGSGSDSYHEYLLKNYVLLLNDDEPMGDVEHSMLQSYHSVIKESLSNGIYQKEKNDQSIKYPVENNIHYQHLLCFVPGMLALGYKFTETKLIEDKDLLSLAIDLTEGCWETYKSTTTSLGPDSFFFPNGYHSGDSGYFLRPELVESIFVLNRITNDTKYKDLAWKIFQSIESHCKDKNGAYVSLLDVFSGQKKDEMPSFFLAETLKYLFLTFAPPDYISLNDFVFTTEAHPLRRISTMKNVDCVAVTTTLPVAPILSWSANLLLGWSIYKMFQWFLKRKRGNSSDNKKIL